MPVPSEVYNISPAFGAGGFINRAGAVFNVQNDQPINSYPYSGYFNNAGMFHKGPTTTGTTTMGVVFNNTGTVDVESGTVVFGSGAGTGTFNAAGGAAVYFSGDNSGTAFTGAGIYTVSYATVTMAGSVQNVVLSGATLNGGSGTSISNLTWSDSTLQGAITITGSANWTGGAIGAGSTFTIVPNAVLNISGSNTLNLIGVLSNAGTVNWAGTGTLEVYNLSPDGYTGGIVNLAGAVFNVQNDQAIGNWNNYNGYFNNAGLFQKGPTTGTTSIGVAFNNTGIVDVQSGTVAFNGGGVDTGTFNAAGGAGVSFGNNYSGTAFTGAGIYTVGSGTVTMAGSVQNVVLSGGTLNSGSGTSMSSLTWSGGVLQGTSSITGSGSWTGGAIGAGSTFTIVPNAVLNISGSNTLNLIGVLSNAGTVNWAGTGTLEVYNLSPDGYTGGIVNLAGAVFNVQNDQAIGNWNNYNGYFNNAGLFQKGPTTGTTSIGVAFNNTGIVDVQAGC